METSGKAIAQGTERCGAKTRTGGTCGKSAGWGTASKVGRCKLHGGATPNGIKAAEKEMARRACDRLGIPIETHPAEALVREVCETAGNVEFYRSLVQELPTHPEPGGVDYVDDDGLTHYTPGKTGVYGPTYHQSGLPTGEAKPHVLVQLYNEERKHLLAATSAALKAGVEARRVELAEREASLIAEGFRSFAVACGLDPASPKVREAFRAQLTLIAGGRSA